MSSGITWDMLLVVSNFIGLRRNRNDHVREYCVMVIRFLSDVRQSHFHSCASTLRSSFPSHLGCISTFCRSSRAQWKSVIITRFSSAFDRILRGPRSRYYTWCTNILSWTLRPLVWPPLHALRRTTTYRELNRFEANDSSYGADPHAL